MRGSERDALRLLVATLLPGQRPESASANQFLAGGQILPSNLPAHADAGESANVWDEPDASTDIAFVAGVLGLVAGLLVVVRLSTVAHFPDSLFWRALPPLLVVPPGFFLGALLAPGGPLEPGTAGSSRAVWLALSGFASYVSPLLVLSSVAALACLR